MQWTQDEAIAFECAREVITDLMAILTSEIAAKERKPNPDTAQIEQLREQRSKLFKERRHLRVKNHAEVARIRTEYGAKIRKWRADHKAIAA